MPDFDLKILSHEDGSWDAFCDDWKAQCEKVEETFEDYAPEALGVITGIMSNTVALLDGAGKTVVAALWDAETKHYYSACVLHRALLPGAPGYTLRVRQLVVCPLLDFGLSDIEMYPDVIIGVVLGVVHASSTSLVANSIRFHLRSPGDRSFFRAFGTSLNDTKAFASVQTHASWLYIEKTGADVASAEE